MRVTEAKRAMDQGLITVREALDQTGALSVMHLERMAAGERTVQQKAA